MSYRKALEKQGFQPSSDSFPGAPDSDAPSASNPVADDGGDSVPVPSFVSLDLDLGDVVSRLVQVTPLVDGDCQPCSDGDSSASSGTSIDVDTGLETVGLAIAPLGLCLPDVSVLSLPALSGLLAGGEYAGDHDATGSTGADGPSGCQGSTDGDEASAGAQADISINVSLNLGGDTSADALVSGTPLLGDADQSDGLLGGAILAGCGGAGSSPGTSVGPEPILSIDGVLEGLVPSTYPLHVLDCSDCGS